MIPSRAELYATYEALADPTRRRRYQKVTPVEAIEMTQAFAVETPEGTMFGRPGDYLLLGALGDAYPCKRDVFHTHYAPCPGELPTNVTPFPGDRVRRSEIE